MATDAALRLQFIFVLFLVMNMTYSTGLGAKGSWHADEWMHSGDVGLAIPDEWAPGALRPMASRGNRPMRAFLILMGQL
ncbi:MAG: hypothetical protein CSA07_01000 [Bacteroidia bacterium]|nr:MAG: hypothetical protein CSA07_01000 [Bacteroidia bacterium]